MIDIGARRTEQLLPYVALVNEVRQVVQRDREGGVQWVQRTGVTLRSGTSVWSMVAADEETAVNKTVTVNPSNRALGLSTVGGQVAVFDTNTGAPVMVLDGPTLTARRTAAVSSLAVQTLKGDAQSALIIGSGVSARAHVECLVQVNNIRSFRLHGRNPATVNRLAQFVRGLGARCDVSSDLIEDITRSELVITATSSATPVIPDVGARSQLFIAVGAYQETMAELPVGLVLRADRIVVDHLEAAKQEAGDLIQAGIDWTQVQDLSELIGIPDAAPTAESVIFKSVGHSLWDLAAAKLARRSLPSVT